MQIFKESIQEVVKKWKAGELVWSADLGGIGPGYEQAIQVLLFEICAEQGDKPLIIGEMKKYPSEYEALVDRKVGELRAWGFSGAQVDQARSTAFQFLTIGYSEIMNKLPDDRRIMVDDSLMMKFKK